MHLGVLPAGGAPATVARRAAAATAGSSGAGPVDGTAAGLSPYLSLLLATSCVLAGEDPDQPLSRALACTGAEPLVGVAWWALARAVLIDDGSRRSERVGHAGTPRAVLAVCSWLPPAWIGQSVEVHGLATRAGRLSWALRWHGARPALLWELEGDGVDVKMQAPGLDPTWSATGRRGEAMIAPGCPGE
ncbi:MAG TPA: hypothetical protein VGG23_08635 [Acidimicrobiales bacterium]